MKRVLPEFQLSDKQLNSVRQLAADCSLTQTVASILYARGIDTAEKVRDFLHPSKERFIEPLTMKGMEEAKSLIIRARDEQWDVLVYGDYDADGVCAATIMSGALADFGVKTRAYVPERRNGYGVTIASLEELFEDYFPQLVITVDCGISNAREVEYLKESGCEVIVTDHHELPAEIPDCICINPKFDDSYPYDNLCGAGVAFKVACALNGEDAHKYLDFAALATVADSVPLTGENRDIVAEGLRLINASPRKCFSDFISKSQEGVDAHTLAFSVAPKINAAGRMGDAASALALFRETDEKKIAELSAKLTAYNQERQLRCDELYVSAKAKLAQGGAYGRLIMLADDGWNSGFVGIVAARLAEEFGRPVLLFVNKDGILRGSARSIEGVNIYAALKACSQYISEFGGHSQAAGLNVAEENFPLLEQALHRYLEDAYTAEDFVPTLYVCSGMDENPVRVARELDMLEPFGVGNKRPLFAVSAQACKPRPVKPQSPHLTVKRGGLELMFFGGLRFFEILQCSAPKQLVFEYNVSHFRGREYIRGFIRDVIYPSDSGADAGEYIAANAVSRAARGEADCNISYMTAEEIDGMLADGCGGYGTVYIAEDYATLSKYKNAAKLQTDLFALSSRSLADCIIVAPRADCDLSGFKRIVWLDRPLYVNIPSAAGKNVTVCSDIDGTSALKGLDTSRGGLLGTFAHVSANAGVLVGTSAEEVTFSNRLPCSTPQFMFALKVFEELSLISFSECGTVVYRGVKTELSNSRLYRAVEGLKSGEL